ncbi:MULTISPECIES: GNAT family N-acetyltransferase [Oceanobacillus]|uniref:Phosphinothricin acetyltransferase n=1 Tax=Oceanobacillus kimchii TaxID=746691 RepID=A0ABQ5TG66_9BACI|nr:MULTISPECIES: GNAT family N-acetyltransferase [Oceanobacillus]MBT2653086.1 N-acetyltransferase [Oceanobacillus sp. ISL-73]OEH53817.1 phosphinothricin acetyltransferase [Oceanobacillus sp. E9]GLO64589.1 phosphinothricin acetyltransferase [Oceanobacillus kimchii]
MSEKLTFRNATIEDLPEIVAIYNSTIASRMVTADTEPVTVEDRYHWFSEHESERRPLLVAELNGEICGWISLESFYGRPAYNHTAEVSIYMDSRFRGKGLGKKLLSYIIEKSPVYGIEILLGFIFAHNEPSIKLFEHFGFEQWAHLPSVAKLDRVDRDVIIFGKSLIK